MAAPRSPVYVAPASSPLAGTVFQGTSGTSQAYNQYLQANARALGFQNYTEQKAIRKSSGFLFEQEKRGTRFGPAGTLTPQDRSTLNALLAQFKGQDMTDRRRGGSLDRFLIALGRRTGQETYDVGETPK